PAEDCVTRSTSDENAAPLVRQRGCAGHVDTDKRVEDGVVVSATGYGEPVSEVAGKRVLRDYRLIVVADGVVVCVAVDQDPVAAVRQKRIPLRAEPDDVRADRYSRRFSADLQSVIPISGKYVGANGLITARCRDEHAVVPVRGRAFKGEQSAERVERNESARRSRHFDSVAHVAGRNVPKRNDAAHLRVG